jgi:glycerol-3-phosphate O-acyltransferase
VSEASAALGRAVAAHSGPLLFIGESSSRLEKRLLDDCIDRFLDGRNPPVAAERVFLKTRAGGKTRASSDLAVRLDLADDTLLVPVRMSWVMPGIEPGARHPLALRSLAFGDPRRPGLLRGRRILRQYPERVQCMAGKPATLAELRAMFESQGDATAAGQPEAFAAFVARQAALALEIAEWDQIGRRYKSPQFVAEALRRSPKLQTAVKDLARETSRPEETLWREAAGYMKELIAVPNALFIELRARFDNFVLSLSYSKHVVCRDEDLERLRSIVQQHPAMLLFTHKTYIDSVALTAKLFEKDFPMLHVFAGINMGFAGMGLLMRRSGGIFIRRSFHDKPLYKVVLRHYIGFLMEKRFPMSWAFEGTRSRTGKLMPPRYGLLKYVLEAANTTEARDVHVIPVVVSYDLMRDVEEYASEQLGRVKQPESLKWFIGYLSSLRRPMGRMYLDFGDPVVLERAPDTEDSLALSKIAFEVAVQANKVTPITLPAITCMVLLGAAPRALTLRELQLAALKLVRWSRDRGIRVTSDFTPERLGHVRDLANAMVEMGLLIRYDEGSDTVFGIEPDKHPVASYYRNTIIHHFVNKALIELALLGTADAVSGAQPVDPLERFRAETERLRDLFKFEFFYPEKTEFRQQVERELSRTDPDWQGQLGRDGQKALQLLEESRPLVAHASLVPFVEAYSVVFDLLARLDPSATLDEADGIARALKEGRQAYLQRRITSEASIGKLLFGNALRLAANLGLTSGQAAEGGADLRERRIRLLREFKELSRRLDRIRLMAWSADPDPR